LPPEHAFLAGAFTSASALPQPLLAIAVIDESCFWIFEVVSTDDSLVGTLV
jgi:hypothetical protein